MNEAKIDLYAVPQRATFFYLPISRSSILVIEQSWEEPFSRPHSEIVGPGVLLSSKRARSANDNIVVQLAELKVRLRTSRAIKAKRKCD